MSWHFLAKPVPSRPFPVGTTGRQGRDDYPISRPVSRRDRDSRRGGPGPWGSLGLRLATILPDSPPFRIASIVVGILGIPDCGSLRLQLRNGQVCRDGHTYAVRSVSP